VDQPGVDAVLAEPFDVSVAVVGQRIQRRRDDQGRR
jgi:hypothetical protein